MNENRICELIDNYFCKEEVDLSDAELDRLLSLIVSLQDSSIWYFLKSFITLGIKADMAQMRVAGSMNEVCRLQGKLDIQEELLEVPGLIIERIKLMLGRG